MKRMIRVIQDLQLHAPDKLPGHSNLIWEISIPKPKNIDKTRTGNKRFNTKSIPDRFMNNSDVLTLLRETIVRIEFLHSEEESANKAYDEFTNFILQEMEENLKCIKNRPRGGKSFYKPTGTGSSINSGIMQRNKGQAGSRHVLNLINNV